MWWKLENHFTGNHPFSSVFLICPECDYDTKEENLLKNHVTENHSLSSIFPKCPECDFDTKEENLMENHFTENHFTKNHSDWYFMSKYFWMASTNSQSYRHLFDLWAMYSLRYDRKLKQKRINALKKPKRQTWMNTHSKSVHDGEKPLKYIQYVS